MAEKYTVQTAMPTGQQSPQFGTEFHVKFAESEQTFKLWYKNPPTQGQEVYGTIDGWKFKKEKKEWNPSSNSAPAAQGAPSTQGTSSGFTRSRDNSDGQRQGMCINNAAAFVNNNAPNGIEAKDWAKMVHAYATALYRLGDLTKEDVVADVDTSAPITIEELNAVFPT